MMLHNEYYIKKNNIDINNIEAVKEFLNLIITNSSSDITKYKELLSQGVDVDYYQQQIGYACESKSLAEMDIESIKRNNL